MIFAQRIEQLAQLRRRAAGIILQALEAGFDLALRHGCSPAARFGGQHGAGRLAQRAAGQFGRLQLDAKACHIGHHLIADLLQRRCALVGQPRQRRGVAGIIARLRRLEYRLPTADIFIGIERAELPHVKLYLRRRAAAQHPAITVERAGDGRQIGRKALLETRLGKQIRHAERFKFRRVGKGLRLAGEQRAAHQTPRFAAHLLLEQGERALFGAHRCDNALRGFNQRAIEQRTGQLPAKAAFVGQQSAGVGKDPRAGRSVFLAGEFACHQIGFKPLQDIAIIAPRPGTIAQHQIDLERLIHRHRIITGPPQRAFGCHDQARQQIALQPVAIGARRFIGKPAAVQAETLPQRRRGGRRDAVRQPIAQCIKHVEWFGKRCRQRYPVARIKCGLAALYGLGARQGCILAAAIIDETGDQRARQPQRDQPASASGGELQRAIALAARHVGASKPGFGDDDFGQQAVDEEGARVRRARALALADGGRKTAEQAVERRSLLHPAGEVKTAQARSRGVRRGSGASTEYAIEQADKPGAQIDEARRQRERGAAPYRIAFVLQPVGQAIGQRLHGIVITGGKAGLRRPVGYQRQRVAHNGTAAFHRQIIKKFGEAHQQISLGEQHIHRQFQPQFARQFGDAGAQRDNVPFQPFGIGLAQLIKPDGNDHTVERLQRPGFLECTQELAPTLRIFAGAAVLAGIAAGGIDQHGFIGEPPIAVARAAHPGGGFIGEQSQPAFLDQRRLAGTWRPDDDIPRLGIKTAPTPFTAALPLHLIQRGPHLGGHGFAFKIGRFGNRLGQCGISLALPPRPPTGRRAKAHPHQRNQPPAQRQERGHEQPAHEEDDERRQQGGANRQHPPIAQKLADRRHHSLRGSTSSTRRFCAFACGLSARSTGS